MIKQIKIGNQVVPIGVDANQITIGDKNLEEVLNDKLDIGHANKKASEDLGHVRIGTGININEEGVISVDANSINALNKSHADSKATKDNLGHVKIGDGLNVTGDGVISISGNYVKEQIIGNNYATADSVKALNEQITQVKKFTTSNSVIKENMTVGEAIYNIVKINLMTGSNGMVSGAVKVDSDYTQSKEEGRIIIIPITNSKDNPTTRSYNYILFPSSSGQVIRALAFATDSSITYSLYIYVKNDKLIEEVHSIGSGNIHGSCSTNLTDIDISFDTTQ